jgi:SAM-dependent methyltransferase
MSKLYDLIKFRNYLIDKLDNFSLHSSIEDKIELVNKTKNIFFEHSEYLDEKINDYLKVCTESKKIIDEINTKISQLNIEIDNTADLIFDNQEYRDQFSENHIYRNIPLSMELQSWIESKITHGCDWHYPALQINPRFKKWIDIMVAADPLYLTHTNILAINELIKDYPQLYQRRLRVYEIENKKFSILPQGQFSFVLCWDTFNYLSTDKIEQYLKEVFQLLRPGGRFIFSYNNCDLPGPALAAELDAASFVTARWLVKLCGQIGYEIIESHDVETGDAFTTHISWIEIKKPGNLRTVKAAQAIATIFEK